MRFLKVMKLQLKRLLQRISKPGNKLTGQTIDLSQFNKPKRKKKSRKSLNKPGAPGAAGAANKIKGKGLS
jgi:hypothetical protein